MRPNAQTMGSARAVNGLNFFAANMPNATQENPARHVTIPNMKLTLQHRHTQILAALKLKTWVWPHSDLKVVFICWNLLTPIFDWFTSNAVVTCEIKLFQNYFSLRQRPSEIILFQCMETCLTLFQNYFTGLLQLMNIFQHAHCCWNNFETSLELCQQLKYFYFSFRCGYIWNKTLK